MLTSTVCVALSAAGLAIALLTAYRRRYLAATRTAALALLPVGLYMTGLLTLGRKVGQAVGTWAVDLVFKPSVWMGFGVLAVSAVLFAGARLAGRRRGRGRGTGKETGSGRRERPAVATAGAAAPALARRRKDEPESGDFSEIEEILKRRGI
jgi:hypothetical protein